MAKIKVSEDGLAQMVRALLKDDQDSVMREVLQNADDAKASIEYSLADYVN
jgi:SLT domain-containing protein